LRCFVDVSVRLAYVIRRSDLLGSRCERTAPRPVLLAFFATIIGNYGH